MMIAMIVLALGLILVFFIYSIEKKLIEMRRKEFSQHVEQVLNIQNSILTEIHTLKDEIAEPLIQLVTNDIIDLSNQMGYFFEKLDNIEHQIQLQSYKDDEKKVSSGNKKTRTPEQKARMSQLAKERWLRRKQPYLLTMQAEETPSQSS